MFLDTHARAHTHIHTHMRTHTCTCTHTHNARAHTCTWTRAHTCARAHARTHTQTHTHTHIYIKQMQINTTEHLNLQRMTTIKVNCYMPWVSCNVKSLLVHRLTSGNTCYCGGMGINFLTHNTHAHAQLYVHATLLLCVRTLSMPAACLLLHQNRVTHWHYFAVATSLATLSQCL